MDEALNENDLEGRLYAMLHHVDESEGNLSSKENQGDGLYIMESAPKSTVRRYWRTSEPTTLYQKVNTPKEPMNATLNSKQSDLKQTNQTTMPKEEKCYSPELSPTVDLSIFQTPVSQNIQRTIEIIEHDEEQVVLESSDEDEVIEIALPPKPTITIESSDEDELTIINPDSPSKDQPSAGSKVCVQVSSVERNVSASPAPSAVSSVSDEFIRSDCIALNISSRHPDNPSFDFSLHGPDLVVLTTPAKKNKRKKRSKETATSTPVTAVISAKGTSNDECFATPKGKAKNKKQKTRLYEVTDKSVPNADIYDSDSNQSIDTNKNSNSYTVTEKSLPSTDVYESDSNMSESAKELPKRAKDKDAVHSDSSLSPEKIPETSKTTKNNDTTITNNTFETISIVDLTDNDRYITVDEIGDSVISENIVMGNVSGFTEPEKFVDRNTAVSDISKFISTKYPVILEDDMDFHHLKGTDNTRKRRRFCRTTVQAEMEKFYNESWGGENFNHKEILKHMPRDKHLWVIDAKDRMPSLAKRRVTCNYCNRPGHRDDTCRMKPLICYMCGHTGHLEPRCPRKICLNCGSPNPMYSSMCQRCCGWGSLACAECGQRGHPAAHCPDLWRRYHGTIENNMTLERCSQTKKNYQLFCSGCTRRGHLIHTCRVTVPFSGLPINSPYVYVYRSIYPPTPTTPNTNQRKPNKNIPGSPNYSPVTTPHRNDRNKRLSKSPTTHETHVNKRRVTMPPHEETERPTKSPINVSQRKSSTSNDESKKDPNKTLNETNKVAIEKAPNFIPLFSANHDKKGNMIQDNEVSDTSDAVTSARVYVTNDIIDKLKTDEGKLWLQNISQMYHIEVQIADNNSFLNVRGKVVDHEGFQAQLREWLKPPSNTESVTQNTETDNQEVRSDQYVNVIPKNRNNLLRQLSKALESLKEDLGDPNALYKELMYLQKRHQNLLKQKIVNPKQVTNNRGHINQMLKRLNMVLLGQAGLADGTVHLNELISFQEKLMNSRQKNIPTELRNEIGQHYTIIFTSLPRNDYIDLLKKYHISNKTTFLTKKKKKPLRIKPTVNRLQKKVNSIPPQPVENGGTKEVQVEREEKVAPTDPHTMQQLAFYHKRVLRARPTGAVQKKTRLILVRKLYSYIASMYRKENMSSKARKKMKKTQEQAQLFLSNV